jgi:hypothetical protein
VATDRERAKSDLDAKLRLEMVLLPKIRAQMTDLSRSAAQAMDGGALFDVEARTIEDLQPLLREHYDEVAAIFSSRISRELVGEAPVTPAETAAIAAVLQRFFDDRAQEQAEIIARTNAADADRARTLTSAETARRQAGGEPVFRRDQAVIFGSFFSRKLQGRAGRIACLETQTAAEASKTTEAEVLLDQQPTVEGEGVSTDESPVLKEWVSQGDGDVRTGEFDHLAPDGQAVATNKPFEVSGQELMFPGDRSLGATAGNVINCRCSAVHDVEAIVSERTR